MVRDEETPVAIDPYVDLADPDNDEIVMAVCAACNTYKRRGSIPPDVRNQLDIPHHMPLCFACIVRKAIMTVVVNS